MTTTAQRTGIPVPSRAAGWTAVAAQGGYALLYLLCGYAALAHAADLTGRWGVPAHDDAHDAGWGWSIPVGTILSLGPILCGLGLVVSAVLFLVGHTRGSRALTVSLLTATGATLLILVLSLTPAAQSLAGRLLD